MSRGDIVVPEQQEIQVYAGDTGYIIIAQSAYPDDDSAIVIDPMHAEAICKAIMAAKPKAIEYRKEWISEEKDGAP